MTSNKPKTYLDKVGRKSNGYFFISYSHDDASYVYEQLNKLYGSKVNYWYDKELEVGCVWNERVKSVLMNEHCCGAILFLSAKAVASEAVYNEICCINDRTSNNPNFRIFPILIGLQNYTALITALLQANHADFIGAYTTLLKDGARIFEAGIDEHALSDEKTGESAQHLLEDIIKAAAECSALDGANFDIRNLANWSTLIADDQFVYEFGLYPNNGKNATKIKWKIFNCVGNKIYFISKYCLDFLDYKTIAHPGKISPKQFGLENEDAIVEFSLIPKSVIEKFRSYIGPAIPTDYADSRRSQNLRLFWALDNEAGCGLTLYNSANYEVNDPVPIENEKLTAGIRLYMVLDDDKLDSCKKPTKGAN